GSRGRSDDRPPPSSARHRRKTPPPPRLADDGDGRRVGLGPGSGRGWIRASAARKAAIRTCHPPSHLERTEGRIGTRAAAVYEPKLFGWHLGPGPAVAAVAAVAEGRGAGAHVQIVQTLDDEM